VNRNDNELPSIREVLIYYGAKIRSGNGQVNLRCPFHSDTHQSASGVETKMYNVLDIDRADNWLGVCEGELDTLTMSKCVGIPCVGVPGANSWKKHYNRLLADFERILVFADGDQAGTEFARSLARELPVTIVQLPDGEDVNSIFVKYGADYIKEKAGIE
jgi:5S rRNA maturation endonuclease (ribonuclease M5)